MSVYVFIVFTAMDYCPYCALLSYICWYQLILAGFYRPGCEAPLSRYSINIEIHTYFPQLSCHFHSIRSYSSGFTRPADSPGAQGL